MNNILPDVLVCLGAEWRPASEQNPHPPTNQLPHSTEDQPVHDRGRLT